MTKPKPTTKKASPEKLFDIAKPGASAASPTSKPVLITNRPVMQDPMVNQPAGDETPSAPLLVMPKKVVIKPIHDDLVPEQTPDETPPEPKPKAKLPKGRPIAELTAAKEEESETHAVTVTVKTAAKAEPTPTPVPEPKPDPQPAPEPAKPEAKAEAAKDDPQIEPEKVDEATEAAAKAEAEHAEQVQKLVSSQKYFLPVNRQEKRRTRRFVLLGTLLIIVLAVAWGDVALDAGLVTISQNIPHTHFFATKH